MTQQQLAELVNLSVEMITKLERGVSGASFTAIEALAEALKISPAELFTTEVRGGAFDRRRLNDLTSKLASLSDGDLIWATQLLELALSRKQP